MIYSNHKATQRTEHMHIYIFFFGMYFHEIQFQCEHSTVIYTSIAILHWWFCATTKYPDGIARGGRMVSETHQCYAPIHSIRLCVVRCGNHMPSARWNTTVCRQVYLGVPEKSLTKRVDTQDAVHCTAPTSVCLFIVRICPFVWSWHVVIPDLIGRRFILFPYTLSTGDVQQISVHGRVVTCNFTTIPVPARLLLNIVVRYKTLGIFATGIGALCMPAILNPYPDE